MDPQVDRVALAYHDFVEFKLGLDAEDDEMLAWIKQQPTLDQLYASVDDAVGFAIILLSLGFNDPQMLRAAGVAMIEACRLADGSLALEQFAHEGFKGLLAACKDEGALDDDSFDDLVWDLEQELNQQKLPYYPDSYVAKAIFALAEDAIPPLLDTMQWLGHLGQSDEAISAANEQAFLQILRAMVPLSAVRERLA